jgi:hypothetical protein
MDYNDSGILVVTPEDDLSADRVALNGNFMALADAVFTDGEALIQVMTRAAWTAANPTLSAGVIGVESDTSLYKIGDGSTAWNAPLPYGGRRHADSGGVVDVSSSFSHADSCGKACGYQSHSDSYGTASGYQAHADSFGTASGYFSHAESGGSASNSYAHADSWGTASGYCSHADSCGTACGATSHADSCGTATGDRSHADSGGTASGGYSHADSGGSASGYNNSHADSCGSASGCYSHADSGGTACGCYAHADSCGKAACTYAHAHGPGTCANLLAEYAHASGQIATAGDAQFRRLVAYGSGTSNMLLNGSQQITMPVVAAAWAYTGWIVARNSTGSQAWTISGFAVTTGSSATLVAHAEPSLGTSGSSVPALGTVSASGNTLVFPGGTSGAHYSMSLDIQQVQ